MSNEWELTVEDYDVDMYEVLEMKPNVFVISTT